MAKWGHPWGLCNPWGVLSGPCVDLLCELSEQRILVQMDDQTGNRKFRDLMCIFVDPFGEYADVANDVGLGFNLETAVGQQLDFIGAVIDLQRSGFDDDFYRTILRIQAEILRGQTDGDWTGSVNAILTMVRTFIGPAVITPIEYVLVPPYSFQLIIPAVLTPTEIKVLFRLICRAIYAAVLGFLEFVFPGDNLWDSDPGGVVAQGGIWCSAHGPTVGTCAVWSYVIVTTSC